MASSSSSPSPSAPNDTATASSILQFSPLPTQISADFWHALSTLKLDRLRLNEAPLPLRGEYGVARRVKDRKTGGVVAVQGTLALAEGSLEAVDARGQAGPPSEAAPSSQPLSASSNRPLSVPAYGTLLNYNTAVAFTSADKNALFNSQADEILSNLLHSPEPLRDAVLKFTLLAYADLKKHKFYHWAALPALVAKPGWSLQGGAWSSIEEEKGEKMSEALREHVERYKGTCDAGFALVKQKGKGEGYHLGRITDYVNFYPGGVEENESPTVLFVDPSSHDTAPGWPLRNLLNLFAVRWGVKKLRVICWRDELSFTSMGGKSASLMGTVLLPTDKASSTEGLVQQEGQPSPLPLAQLASSPTRPAAVGWERNAQNKLAPRVADLGPLMDPHRLADQAVDLNLKLMRWRLLPEIDLEVISRTRCLILGAGTLGCYVARLLLAWGVREMTLVDNGKVSFSNPVRQPLFDFEDCLSGGRSKAECAAERLGKVFPGVKAKGVEMGVPMPGHGHTAGRGDKAGRGGGSERDVAHLERLFDEHDAVFLLMDSRESRWLPTLLGAAKGKLVINAALGFDTFLVMRHGAGPPTNEATQEKEGEARRLGCYFCNDVVAPTDSLTDRTLDQMCTVTRPGLAAIASASAVELMVSLLQHPRRHNAPAPPSGDDPDPQCCLGLLPHQLRGSLSSFSSRRVTGQAFDRCTACSEVVVRQYRTEGWAMVRKALGEDPDEAEGYLERLTGLDKMYEETERLLMEGGDVGEWSGSEEDESEL